jgi:hypothetical protein
MMILMVYWRIWKEKNARVFKLENNTVDRVFELIIEDVRAWRDAGCVVSF